MAASRWSIFHGMLNNHAVCIEEKWLCIVLFFAFKVTFSPCCLSSGGLWVLWGIMRVKMNGCPFGFKMVIIIPTWCHQINPQILFHSHGFSFRLIFLLFLCFLS